MKRLSWHWQDLVNASKPAFFRGHTKDTVFDRSRNSSLSLSSEALFTQSNARVLLGHAASGMLRMVALPTQVYPAPTQTGEFGLGPGMYHHFDVLMYAGNLTYNIVLDSGNSIDIGDTDRENETVYAKHFIPLTTTREGDLQISTISFAPVAPDADDSPLAPAPLPGPAGVFHILIFKNHGSMPCKGTVYLTADDLLIGHYEDAAPEKREINSPSRYLRQETLILCRPEGCVGIHLHEGKWCGLNAPFKAKCEFFISPGEEKVFETHLAMGRQHQDIMPVIYDLHMRTALEWLHLTTEYWHTRLGDLCVEADDVDTGEYSHDLYIRSLFDNFNCLQTDAAGNLIAHWQGAPSHGYGTVWGIDVEPTAVSVVHLCPEMTRQAMIFFLNRSKVPKGPPDHSVPILVAPIIIARQWLQVSGDNDYLQSNLHIVDKLMGIISQVISLKAPGETLFPTRYSSDGAVGRRYDYGTNVKVHYAFDSIAYILDTLGRPGEAADYYQLASQIRDAIKRHMVADGPFGPQITGGTNLGEDPDGFYLSEGVFYYDGEDTSSMLAPLYGICDQSDPMWGNYHRFARSLWNPGFDVEFGTLLWSPTEPAIFDGTGFFSRLGGSVSRQEMAESFRVLREIAVDEVTGSVFWWPHGLEYKRSLTRCSQGQGAWAWQYVEQWLGLKVDAVNKILILSPRGLLSKISWEGFKSGPYHFDIIWEEDYTGSVSSIKNYNDTPWTVKTGFRQFGAGAESRVYWETSLVMPGDQVEFIHQVMPSTSSDGLSSSELFLLETSYFGESGYIFKRFGPAQLWGHWDAKKVWDKDAMPLALRFLVQNDTGEDWSNVQVTLTCPIGWRAQGRRPMHWDAADNLSSGAVILDLDKLPNARRTVAPFWVATPESVHISMIWWNEAIAPFHQESQPGAGIKLYTEDPNSEIEVTFMAMLQAEIGENKKIQKILDIPVVIMPKPTNLSQ